MQDPEEQGTKSCHVKLGQLLELVQKYSCSLFFDTFGQTEIHRLDVKALGWSLKMDFMGLFLM